MNTIPLTPGAIVHAYIRCISPPKNKFAIVGCLEPKPRLILINTEQSRLPALQLFQVAIKKADFSFLKHDSWVDCSACVGIDAEDLSGQLADNKDYRVVEAPPLRLLNHVVRALEATTTIAALQREWMLVSLKEATMSKTKT